MRQAKSVALWLLYVVPLAYASAILLVVLHEVVGHGLTAILCGGTFERFEVQPSASGLAWTTEPRGMRVWVLLGGIAWTGGLGLVLAALLRLVRPRPRVRMAGVVLATTLLHDSCAYGFWSAAWTANIGDTWKALQLIDAAWAKPALVVGLGAGLVLTTWVSTAAVVRCLEDALGALGRGLAAATAVGLTAVMYGGYVASGGFAVVGVESAWPGLVATGLQAAACALVLRRRRRVVDARPDSGRWSVALGWAWGAALALFALTFWWLRHGVALAESSPLRFD